jgi:hypothetical protein
MPSPQKCSADVAWLRMSFVMEFVTCQKTWVSTVFLSKTSALSYALSDVMAGLRGDLPGLRACRVRYLCAVARRAGRAALGLLDGILLRLSRVAAVGLLIAASLAWIASVALLLRRIAAGSLLCLGRVAAVAGLLRGVGLLPGLLRISSLLGCVRLLRRTLLRWIARLLLLRWVAMLRRVGAACLLRRIASGRLLRRIALRRSDSSRWLRLRRSGV